MSESNEILETEEGDSKTNKTRRNVRRGCFRLLLLMFLCSIAFAVLCVLLIDVTNSGGRIKRKIAAVLDIKPEPVKAPDPEVKVVEKIVEVPVDKIVEKIVEVKVQDPMPSKYVAWKKVDTTTLWNGIHVSSTVKPIEGQTASLERERDESYGITMEISFAVPKPNDSVGALGSINPNLPNMFKDFSVLIENSEVSPFYHYLYELKTKYIQENATRLDQVLSRHNLYDCETVLQIKHPETSQKVLLIQGEMDVVSDGSDGDRWPELNDYISMSDYYQPFTGYGWKKQTDTPNPLLSRWEEKLKKYEEEFAIKGLSIEKNRFLRDQIDTLKAEISDMKYRSCLIAEADPFIVAPLSFLGRKDENEFGPQIGDYAVVIYEDKLYPAIVGDAGPRYKIGEASLRIAKTLNENASPYNRPVSDLKVTYLIFPDSAEKERAAPDLEKWHQKCTELVEGLGGLEDGFEIHQWEDLVAKRLAEIEAAKKASETDSETPGEPGDDPETSDKKPSIESKDGEGDDGESVEAEEPPSQ